MGAVYPTSLITFTTKTDKIDIVDDSHINDLQNEVIAIETAIGTNPKGSSTDLTTRLGVLIGTDGALQKGAAFPTSPTPIDGQSFYRTDTDSLYIYNGASWLLAQPSVSQVNDIDAGTVFDNDPEVTFLTVNKTITSGKTVMLITSGYIQNGDAGAATHTIRLKHTSTVVQTIVSEFAAVFVETPWSACGIVTGLSGAITFSVTAQAVAPGQVGTAYGNLIVLEF